MPCQVPSTIRPDSTGNRELDCGERGADMRRHIVRALRIVDVASGLLRCGSRRNRSRDQTRTSGSAFSWIRSEADVCRQKSVSSPVDARCSASHRRHRRSDLHKALASCRNLQAIKGLAHQGRSRPHPMAGWSGRRTDHPTEVPLLKLSKPLVARNKVRRVGVRLGQLLRSTSPEATRCSEPSFSSS